MCDVLGVNPLKKGTVPFLVDVDVWRGAAERDMGFRRAPGRKPDPIHSQKGDHDDQVASQGH